MLAHDMTDKGLISKMYTGLMQLNNKNTSNQILNMCRRPKEFFFFPKKTYRGLAGYADHINHQRMQIKTSMRCHLTPVRIVIIKMTANNKC